MHLKGLQLTICLQTLVLINHAVFLSEHTHTQTQVDTEMLSINLPMWLPLAWTTIITKRQALIKCHLLWNGTCVGQCGMCSVVLIPSYHHLTIQALMATRVAKNCSHINSVTSAGFMTKCQLNAPRTFALIKQDIQLQRQQPTMIKCLHCVDARVLQSTVVTFLAAYTWNFCRLLHTVLKITKSDSFFTQLFTK